MNCRCTNCINPRAPNDCFCLDCRAAYGQWLDAICKFLKVDVSALTVTRRASPSVPVRMTEATEGDSREKDFGTTTASTSGAAPLVFIG